MNTKTLENDAIRQLPNARTQYIEQCQEFILQFKNQYPRYWIEYIRGKRPANYHKLRKLRTFARNPNLEHQHGIDGALIRQIVNEKLHEYRRPRGVIVAAVVLKKLYISYSLCKTSAGDQWSKPIAVAKAMKRIADLKILPCLAIEETENGLVAKHNSVQNVCNEALAAWVFQLPISAYSTAARMLTRLYEQGIINTSDLDDIPPHDDLIQHLQSFTPQRDRL